MDQQSDIFDIPPIWKTAPLDAFGAFVMSAEFVELGRHAVARGEDGKPLRTLSPASARIYVLMFGSFLRWIGQRQLRLHEVSAGDIKQFLEAEHLQQDKRVKKLNSLIRVRYLRLLERMYAHLQIHPNPARHAAFDVYRTSAAGRDKPKAYLSEKEQIAFLAQLPVAKALDPQSMEDPSWKKRRDRAMLAMMLGAGLTVAEVLSLRVDQVGPKDATGCVPIHLRKFLKKGVQAHETVLRAFAAPYVLPWIAERKLHKIPSKLLFPATLVSDEPLNKATVYRHAKAAFEKAGIEVERMGGRTLRNSFAVRELANGQPPELVKQMMGHYELRSTLMYDLATTQKPLPE